MASRILLLSPLVSLVFGRPAQHAAIKRQSIELRSSYDFIIAGAGTAGLTVADRLSEAFPDRNVLVIEYGDFEETPGYFEPESAPPDPVDFMLYGEPMTELGNRRGLLQVGKVVSGSSGVNGQFFDRASRHDIDDWARLWNSDGKGNSEMWDWEHFLPWYKMSVNMSIPTEEMAEKYGFTLDYEVAYGGSTPVHACFPPFQWPTEKIHRKAWKEAGVAERIECAAGDKDGICWVPNSQYFWDGSRSTSRVGHYDSVIQTRTNCEVLVKHKVNRVIYDPENMQSPPRVEFTSLDDGTTANVPVELEVILSAGAVHTPNILERSGIGAAHILESAGIDLVYELPGVGYNFHDHGGGGLSYTWNVTFSPSIQELQTNETARKIAEEEYTMRPAQGPYTMGMSNSAIYIPFPNITANHSVVTDAIRRQLEGGLAATFLPEGTPETVVAGYEAQLAILADVYDNPTHPVLEQPFGGPSLDSIGFLLKPLSRGTIHVNPEDPDAEPILDWRTCTNPLDLDIMANFIPFLRSVFTTPTMQEIGATEVKPGLNVTSHEDLVEYVRQVMSPSFYHPCCTAPMMPLEKGGVVGTDLKVHGLHGLSIVDASIMPILPGTHTSSTVYTIGEKAADIIVRRHSM